ncbi:MAG: fused MFS/spermidine synthase, partial [Planctomycetota bacterium]
MGKSKSFLSIAIPSGTVFLSSFCIMVLELVAARLIARHLGSSLYTWTAVIGVVLAGITIGNYLGGRVADRFRPRR